MAASVVSICNQALTILGADRIIDIGEDSENARKCNAVFELLRDEVLSVHPWNFSLKRVSLVQITTAPSFEFSFAYQLPSNCLRVVKTSLGIGNFQPEYSIEDGLLLTNSGSVLIKYISQVTDTTKFSPSFASALAERIAAELAYAINSNEEQRESFLKTYILKQSFAQGINGQEGSGEVSTTDTLTSSRS